MELLSFKLKTLITFLLGFSQFKLHFIRSRLSGPFESDKNHASLKGKFSKVSSNRSIFFLKEASSVHMTY